MRFMILVKADARTEAGQMPEERLLAEMMRFNEELAAAGVLLAGEGLHPTSRGARVLFGGPEPRVVEGPFPQATDLVAGYWVWRCASLEEAIGWARRIPGAAMGGGGVEIRPIFEADDFGQELTPELRDREDRLRARVEAQEAAPHH